MYVHAKARTLQTLVIQVFKELIQGATPEGVFQSLDLWEGFLYLMPVA